MALSVLFHLGDAAEHGAFEIELHERAAYPERDDLAPARSPNGGKSVP